MPLLRHDAFLECSAKLYRHSRAEQHWNLPLISKNRKVDTARLSTGSRRTIITPPWNETNTQTYAHICHHKSQLPCLKSKPSKTLLCLCALRPQGQSAPCHLWWWSGRHFGKLFRENTIIESTGWRASPQPHILPTFPFPLGAVTCLLALNNDLHMTNMAQLGKNPSNPHEE